MRRQRVVSAPEKIVGVLRTALSGINRPDIRACGKPEISAKEKRDNEVPGANRRNERTGNEDQRHELDFVHQSIFSVVRRSRLQKTMRRFLNDLKPPVARAR